MEIFFLVRKKYFSRDTCFFSSRGKNIACFMPFFSVNKN